MSGDAVTESGGQPCPELCPKCGAAVRAEAAACARCGLTVARMAAYVDAQDAAVPEAVRAAWDRAVAGWDDSAAHDELLRLVVANNSFAWAAGRYRTRTDEVAVRQRDRLRRAAEVTLLAGAAARPDSSTNPYRAATSVLAILIVVIAAGLVYATVIHDRILPPSDSGPVAPLSPGHPMSPSTIR
jgi:hypothetical protein